METGEWTSLSSPFWVSPSPRAPLAAHGKSPFVCRASVVALEMRFVDPDFVMGIRVSAMGKSADSNRQAKSAK